MQPRLHTRTLPAPTGRGLVKNTEEIIVEKYSNRPRRLCFQRRRMAALNAHKSCLPADLLVLAPLLFTSYKCEHELITDSYAQIIHLARPGRASLQLGESGN